MSSALSNDEELFLTKQQLYVYLVKKRNAINTEIKKLRDRIEKHTKEIHELNDQIAQIQKTQEP